MRFRLLPPATALAAALTCVLVLSGCMPTDDIITPPPSPSTAPIFASDEEALAAATEAYARYLKVSDEITGEGGLGAERIAEFVTAAVFDEEKAGFKEYQEKGLKTRGSSIVNEMRLQQYLDAGDGTGTVTVYVCVNISDVQIIDGYGNDVTPSETPKISPLEVEFEAKGQTPVIMTISRSELWSGSNFCMQ